MEFYEVSLKYSAEQDLRNIDHQYIPKIIQVIESLKDNPFPLQSRKLRGSENFYRIRIGNYRIIYKVDVKEKMIIIFYIRHRKDAYKNL